MATTGDMTEKLAELKGWMTGLLSGESADAHKSNASVRWLTIFICLVVFFYNMAVPLVSSKKSVYMDLRVGILIWLFASAVLHTPLGSSQVEDHPSVLFVTVFVLLLVVTHITLAAFTMLHHVFAWALGLFAPRLAETLWVPALRSMRSFKTILKASVLLSGSLSTLFAYCVTLPSATSCIGQPESKSIDQCETEGLMVIGRSDQTLVAYSLELVCVRLFPRLDKYWTGESGENGRINLKMFGFDLGRLSLLESPIGLLWISGVALWSTYYTLRRTKRINQTLNERAKRKKIQKLQKIADRVKAMERDDRNEDSDSDEASDEEYDNDGSAESSRSRRDILKRKAPKNFLPMAEWYSLALTETAFQVLVSMKLFLGRFDMRTLQAALPDEKDSDEEEGEMEDDDTDNGYETNFSGQNQTRHKRQKHSSSSKYDSRFADLDEMWFDWMADTGDGGNPTYAVTRALAQPELELPAFNPFSTGKKDSNTGAPNGGVKLEKLKRGDLLIVGGDLAYPTPSIKEYDQRLFVPFEYAMEPPASYHRDDISTSRNSSENAYHLSSRLSFVRMDGTGPVENQITALSLPMSSGMRGRGGRRSATLTEKELQQVTANTAPLTRQSSEISATGRVGMFQIGSCASLNSSNESSSTCSCEDNASCIHRKDQPGTEEETGPRLWTGPPCVYAIPGNHDWFDGLHTYMQCICYRDWLGGWRMPQTKSYFALQLPHGWWMFAMDFGLNDDIDGLQYQYFASIASKFIGEEDQIILACHEPTWVLDAYMNHPHPEEKPFIKSSKNLKQLMRRHLRGKVALRIAGDIHNYMRHDAEQPLNESALRAGAAPVLVVAGGGGAFLHPTHTFPDRFKETGAHYSTKRCYPSVKQSKRVGMKNLGQGFRMQNWKFDFVGSTGYFLMVASFFPRCKLDHIIKARFYPDGLWEFFWEIVSISQEIWTDGVVSLLTVLIVLIATFSFADYHYGKWRQLVIGGVHAAVHVFFAITLFLLLELVVEVSIQDGLAGQGYDNFFNSFQNFERRTMPEAWWTSGFLVSPLKTLLRIFDLPENMATTRVRICTGEVEQPSIFWSTPICNRDASQPISQLTRFEMLTYYGGNFLFLFVIASDIVAMVLGFYLYICVNFLQLHWNEAFSSIRSPDYKSFLRFRIDKDGDLHAYAIGIDSVPREWRQDMKWQSNKERLLLAHFNNSNADVDELDPNVASFGAQFPSRWEPAYVRSRKLRNQQRPHIVDYFCIPRKQKWTKIRRGNSVIEDDWWSAFGDLEKRKVFHKTPRGSQLSMHAVRKREVKSQSPTRNRGKEEADVPTVIAGTAAPTLSRTATVMGLVHK